SPGEPRIQIAPVLELIGSHHSWRASAWLTLASLAWPLVIRRPFSSLMISDTKFVRPTHFIGLFVRQSQAPSPCVVRRDTLQGLRRTYSSEYEGLDLCSRLY